MNRKKRWVVKGFARKRIIRDYGSAALDMFGAVPFVGEVADTARLAKAGINIADAAKDADNFIDTIKAVENVDDVLKTGSNIGELAKPYPAESIPAEVSDWLSRMPKYTDSIEVPVSPNYEQISLLSRQEGVEFASISVGSKNIIIRGNTQGTPISKELLNDMIQNKGILNCHSHPYIGDLQPSKSDLWLAEILSHQKEFEIITPDNMRAVYTKHGLISVGNIPNTISDSDIRKYLELFGG